MASYDKHSDDNLPRFTKDPDSILDYSIDWGTNWLNEGDEIEYSTWSIKPSHTAGLSIESTTNTLTTTKVIVSSGSGGREYRLTNTINTIDGLREDQTLIIEIEEH